MPKTNIAPELAKLLHAKKVWFYGRIPTFENEEHEIELNQKSAASTFAGQEDDVIDRQAHVPIGFVGGCVVLVDVGKKNQPVFCLADGELLKIAPSAEKFVKGTRTEPRPHPKKVTTKADQVIEPKTIPGEKADWPKGDILVWTRTHMGQFTSKHCFLWVDAQPIKSLRGRKPMKDAYYQYMRQGRAAASVWEPSVGKLDRGTGEMFDVARFETLPLVTPRVRAVMEQMPLPGVEFLPLRVTVKKAVGDYFIVHPTTLVDCLDAPGTGIVDAVPEKGLKLIASKVPKGVPIFRLARIPAVILVSGAFAEQFRKHEFSGLHFIAPKNFSSYGYGGPR